jgi:hypothetical protein
MPFHTNRASGRPLFAAIGARSSESALKPRRSGNPASLVDGHAAGSRSSSGSSAQNRPESELDLPPQRLRRRRSRLAVYRDACVGGVTELDLDAAKDIRWLNTRRFTTGGSCSLFVLEASSRPAQRRVKLPSEARPSLHRPKTEEDWSRQRRAKLQRPRFDKSVRRPRPGGEVRVMARRSAGSKWGYLLLSETDIKAAKGSWPALKKMALEARRVGPKPGGSHRLRWRLRSLRWRRRRRCVVLKRQAVEADVNLQDAEQDVDGQIDCVPPLLLLVGLTLNSS